MLNKKIHKKIFNIMYKQFYYRLIRDEGICFQGDEQSILKNIDADALILTKKEKMKMINLFNLLPSRSDALSQSTLEYLTYILNIAKINNDEEMIRDAFETFVKKVSKIPKYEVESDMYLDQDKFIGDQNRVLDDREVEYKYYPITVFLKSLKENNFNIKYIFEDVVEKNIDCHLFYQADSLYNTYCGLYYNSIKFQSFGNKFKQTNNSLLNRNIVFCNETMIEYLSEDFIERHLYKYNLWRLITSERFKSFKIELKQKILSMLPKFINDVLRSIVGDSEDIIEEISDEEINMDILKLEVL